MKPEERARAASSSRSSIRWRLCITNSYFLRSALKALRRERGEPELDPIDLPAVFWNRSSRQSVGTTR